MIVTDIQDLLGTERDVDWGNGQSRRFLLDRDGMGFALMETTVLAGSESRQQYRNHLEACYCIEGEGEIEDETGRVHPLRPGVMYALNQHDVHVLRARTPMRLISVFNPPLKGNERHSHKDDDYSSY
jgi:L-ectoine synthase